jgi:asparagine synthase (glutamine-hydrolysing)
MCGIAGSINFQLDIPRLREDIWHRGPDEQDLFRENTLELYHHRLSIIDISCGKQPMQYGDLTLIYNGEIYNHLELRKKYQLQCTTDSDTETLLHLYKKTGHAFLNDIDGMFAMALFDRSANRVFIARDRAGKKPFYYYNDNKSFVFASELNALKGQLDLKINTDHIHQYIRLGYFYRSSTPYQNVHELPAGSYGYIDLDTLQLEIHKWWDIHDFYLQRSTDSFDTAKDKVETFLREAVRRRVEASDLEVGSFLSGGIDSGLVTAMAKEFNPSLKTFTVSFAGEYDEAPLAKQVADKYQTDHHEIKITFDHLQDDVETIISNYGEPFFDSSAIPSYYVSREAKKHLTVILNGDGGDEVFGGYRRYVAFNKFDFFRSNPLVKWPSKIFSSILPEPNNKKSKYNFIYRLMALAGKDDVNTYLSATIDSFEGFEKYLNAPPGVLKKMEADFRKVNNAPLSGLQKIMNLDFDNILQSDLLVKMDIATMAHSLEGRSPLLSKELLEYAPTLPDSYKIRGSQTKYILRTLAEKYLPSDLIHQPKRGFEIPLKNWIDNQLKDILFDYIFSVNAYNKEFIDPVFLQKLWDKRLNVGEEKRAKMLWTIFALEVWHKKVYLNRN